jgi:hypothetical protein
MFIDVAPTPRAPSARRAMFIDVPAYNRQPLAQSALRQEGHVFPLLIFCVS